MTAHVRSSDDRLVSPSRSWSTTERSQPLRCRRFVRELHARKPVAQATEQPAGLDLGELGGVADQHHLGGLLLGVGEQPGELAVPTIPASSTTTTPPGGSGDPGMGPSPPASGRCTVIDGMPDASSSPRAARAASEQPTTRTPSACQMSWATFRAWVLPEPALPTTTSTPAPDVHSWRTIAA